MSESERKFIVDPEGNAEEVESPEGKKKTFGGIKKKRLITFKEKRKFVVDEKGGVEVKRDQI